MKDTVILVTDDVWTNLDKTLATDEILRIIINNGGCAGFQYEFKIDQDTNQDDIVIEQNNRKIVIDTISAGLIKGATLKFVDTIDGFHYELDIPSATFGCGCGTSFSI